MKKTGFLTSENANSLIGKKIMWFAPAYRHNETYGGVAIITAVDISAYRPIAVKDISGDGLGYAIIDMGGELAYSDSDRHISFVEL